MNDLGGLGRLLLAVGLVLAAAGALLLLGQALPGLRIGRLPGDIRIVRDGFRFYFPLTTMVVLSLLLSGLLWVLRRIGK